MLEHGQWRETQSEVGGAMPMSLFGQLSLSLGFFNLFPIPILDGGHMTLILLEVVRRRKPPSQQLAPVLGALESLGLCSAYHAHFDVAQGEEQHATYWHLHREDRPFHIDHIFTSPDLTVTNLEVGTGEDFHERSDHAPMFAELMSTV